MKNKKKIKVPAYAFGTEQISNMIKALPEATTLIASPFQQSTATSGGEAFAQSVAGIGQGINAGMEIGKNFGAAGALVGGAIGAGVGLIGKGGREASMSSFTELDEGTLGTGLTGMFKNRRLRRKRNRLRQIAANNRDAVRGTNYLQNEYGEDYGDMDVNTFADGGYTSSLSLIDHGEVLEGPDGQIQRIPDKKNAPTDSIKAILEPGTRILSDKLKDPDSKETFAKLYNKMTSNRKSIYKDAFAQNAEKLNNINNQEVFNQLFYKQEQLKRSKGIKPKYKEIQSFDGGGLKKYGYDTSFKDYDNLYSPQYMNFVNSLKENDNTSTKWLNRINSGEFGNIGGNTFSISDIKRLATDRKKGSVHNAVIGASKAYSDAALNSSGINSEAATGKKIIPKYPDRLIATNSEMAGIVPPKGSLNHVDNITKLPYKPFTPPEKKSINWNSALSGIASLAPIMSNLFTGKPESVDAVYNPYATAITNTMRRRRFNIDPAIQDINRNRAISNYNMRQMNTSTGANLAYGLQSAINTDKAIANLRSMESNANNQYLGEYANTMNNLGQQWVNATNLAAEANAQNRATNRNIRRTGISQLSQWAQNRELMRNQEARDNAMLAMYGPFLQAGYTANTIKEFNRWLNKGGNYVG